MKKKTRKIAFLCATLFLVNMIGYTPVIAANDLKTENYFVGDEDVILSEVEV